MLSGRFVLNYARHRDAQIYFTDTCTSVTKVARLRKFAARIFSLPGFISKYIVSAGT